MRFTQHLLCRHRGKQVPHAHSIQVANCKLDTENIFEMGSKLLLRTDLHFHFLKRRCGSEIFRNHLLSQRQEPFGSTRWTGIESNRGELLTHVIRHPCDRWMELITSWCDHINIITWDSHEYLDSRGNSQHCRNSLALPLGWGKWWVGNSWDVDLPPLTSWEEFGLGVLNVSWRINVSSWMIWYQRLQTADTARRSKYGSSEKILASSSTGTFSIALRDWDKSHDSLRHLT